MINKLNIYTNLGLNNFLNQLFPKHKIEFRKIDDLLKDDSADESGIIFQDTKAKTNKINFNKLMGYYLIISNENEQLNKSQPSNNYIFIKAPIDLGRLKSDIENFVSNKKNKIKDIEIVGKKIINYSKNISCFLTEVESEILSQLIKNKYCKKSFIKENVLNIKSDIETNSLESHLTRIRKKLDNVKSNIKIQSKNEKIYLFIDSEFQD